MRVAAAVIVALFVSACGPKTMEARLRDAERAADKASGYLDEAEKAGIQLEPKKMESALNDAKDKLAEKDIELHPETQMHMDRYKELAAKLPAVKAEREKRDLELRLNKARDKIVPRVQAMLEAQEALVPSAPTTAQVDAVEGKAKLVKEALDDELDLFVKDADFAAWAKSQRNKSDKALEAAGKARKGAQFIDGPVAAWKDALALQQGAKEKKAVSEQKASLEQARTKLAACERGAKPFDEDKVTSAVAFSMPTGKPQTPSQLQAACAKALKDGEAEFKKVSAALDAERAKQKAKEEKEAKEKAAAEAKAKKEQAAADAKAAKEKAAADAKAKKEQAAADAKAAKEKAAADAKAKKEQAAADAKAAKEKAAADAKAKKEKAAADAKAKKDKAAADAKAKKDKAAADAKAKQDAKKK